MVAAKSKPIPAKWRKLFKLIPGYDPLATAGACHFEAKAADEKIDFFAQCIKHAKGTPAIPAGAPFILEPWEKAIVGCLFGWKRPDGTRRYRECFLYVPKKTGKTALVAGIEIIMHTIECEFGAELYSAAASREQASLVFQHIVGMIHQEPELSARLEPFGTGGGSIAKSVVNNEQMASYKCLIADANNVDGMKVHFAAIDELHRHKKPDLAELLRKSTGANRQPLIVFTTTADYNRPSLCNEMLKYAKSVRDNPGDPSKPGFDEEFLPVIYEASKEDDYMNPKTWRKANPNLGVTVPERWFAREAKIASESPTLLNNFLRLHLNIVTDADVAFFDMAQWDACGGAVNAEELRGRPCYAGLDLSTTIDLTALVLLFPEDGNAILPFFFVPRENAVKRQRTVRCRTKRGSGRGILKRLRAMSLITTS